MKLALIFFISSLFVFSYCFAKKEKNDKVIDPHVKQQSFFADENLIIPPLLFAKKEGDKENVRREASDKDFLMNFSRKD